MKNYTHAINGLLLGFVIIYIVKIFSINIVVNKLQILMYSIYIIIFSIILDYIEITIFDKHKRQLHTLFILLIPILIIFLKIIPQHIIIGFAMFVGFLSHIFLDLLTPTGCPLFYPLTHHFYKFTIKHNLLIKTGTSKEKTFAVCLIFVLIVVIIGTGFILPGLYGFDSNNNYEVNNSSFVHSNININIKDNEQKNITYIDENNHTSTIIISNYGNNTTNV